MHLIMCDCYKFNKNLMTFLYVYRSKVFNFNKLHYLFQVYWVGPILGGVVAALLYHHVFAAPNLGPLKIIERYTAVVTDENEVSNLNTQFLCSYLKYVNDTFFTSKPFGTLKIKQM